MGTGLLAAEAPILVEFLAHDWLGAAGKGGVDDGLAYYGRPRATQARPSNRDHNGGLAGVNAWVMQFVGEPFSYNPLPRDERGDYDFEAPLPEHSSRCEVVPGDVNLALLLAQDDSAHCEACNVALSRLRNALMEALCEVDWAE